LRVAYADPPYIGWSGYYRKHPDYAGEVDHEALIRRLSDEFSDGWALSCSSNSLRTLLPLCPEDARVLAWVKPFASFKPNINPAYAWEPVIMRGGHCLTYRQGGTTVRDWLSEPMSMRKGLVGVKPDRFSFWLFEALGLTLEDELVDLFPGSGAVTRAWGLYREKLAGTPLDLQLTMASAEG
jgi:hypothetical protein